MNEELDAARSSFLSLAKAYDGTGDMKPLCEAATTYARERVRAAPPADVAVVLPFSKQKGVAITEATLENLTWVRGKIAQTLDLPEKAQWRDANVTMLAALDDEILKR